MDSFHGLLTSVVFLPMVGALLIATLIKNPIKVKILATTTTVINLLLSAIVFIQFNPDGPERFQLVDRFHWFSSTAFTAQYQMGVDGISTPLVLLTGLLSVCAVLASWNINVRVREYFIWILILQTSVMGVFVSLDFIMFFVFWELELIPMYFLISIWGTGRKRYSAMKFLVFTFLGSAFMLIGILTLLLAPNIGGGDMAKLAEGGTSGAVTMIPMQLVFWLFFLGFAIKLPIFPFHTWLPDAHTDAPTAVSIMLAGVLLKMGGYGLLRISIGMFPKIAEGYALELTILAVITILYAAIITLKQTDLKRLIAYSSISHMGLVLLGIGSIGTSSSGFATIGLTGAAMQLFTHGTITGLLFLSVGVIYEKAHTRYIPDLGGLATRMPLVTICFIIGGLASLGLPGMSGFVSEALVFLGTFKSFPILTSLGAFAIVITAGYILWMIERVFFGPEKSRFAELTDGHFWTGITPMALLIITILGIGIYPSILTRVFEAGIEPIANLLT